MKVLKVLETSSLTVATVRFLLTCSNVPLPNAECWKGATCSRHRRRLLGCNQHQNAKVSGNGQLLSNANCCDPKQSALKVYPLRERKGFADLNILDFCKNLQADRANECHPEEYEAFGNFCKKKNAGHGLFF